LAPSDPILDIGSQRQGLPLVSLEDRGRLRGYRDAPRERSMIRGEIACPKCKHQMQEGFLLDRGGPSVAEWVEGPPDYGWLGLKWFRRKRVLITAYRCPSCGYLEAYARAK
jgi:hypothetical protein